MRESIVDAVYELMEAGEVLPTAELVAERAGVSARSVFRHFRDMDTLYGAIAERVADLLAPQLAAPVPDVPLRERIEHFVARRAEMFERVAPFRRAGTILHGRSEEIARTRRSFDEVARKDLLAYLPELKDRPQPLGDAAELLTSFEAWDGMRRDRGLSPERAAVAVSYGLKSLLGLE